MRTQVRIEEDAFHASVAITTERSSSARCWRPGRSKQCNEYVVTSLPETVLLQEHEQTAVNMLIIVEQKI